MDEAEPALPFTPQPRHPVQSLPSQVLSTCWLMNEFVLTKLARSPAKWKTLFLFLCKCASKSLTLFLSLAGLNRTCNLFSAVREVL